ncbi:TIGR03619 family F420-dependent LLM class oxidoreductase [Streptomyces eurythermus]|uniref:TIGR03619 family F420-dependent LLM class oxidoreductase n=1 Tax=Streptomyces eurythermus TaxID=42237 RepID=UPI0036FA32A0
MAPTIGLFSMNFNAAADPATAERIARLTERLGYDSLWVGDHVVLPSPRTEASPLDPGTPLLDPVVALTHLAARTEHLLLGAGCIVLPQRNPLVLAKQLASVDVLSSGRLLFGVGVGYLEPELRALGVDPRDRARRAEEYLDAMESLWYDKSPAFQGIYTSFEGVDAHPRPAQTRVPVVIGGHSTAAHRRAVTRGDAWFGYLMGLRATAQQVAALRALAVEHGRDRPLHISVAPARRLGPEVVRAYRDLGVDRLVVVPPVDLTADQLADFVEAHAPARLGAAPRP